MRYLLYDGQPRELFTMQYSTIRIYLACKVACESAALRGGEPCAICSIYHRRHGTVRSLSGVWSRRVREHTEGHVQENSTPMGQLQKRRVMQNMKRQLVLRTEKQMMAELSGRLIVWQLFETMAVVASVCLWSQAGNPAAKSLFDSLTRSQWSERVSSKAFKDHGTSSRLQF